MTDLNEQGTKLALEALAGVAKTVNNAMRRAEQQATEAEAALLDYRKLKGFVDIEIERHRANLRAIEDAKLRGATEQ